MILQLFSQDMFGGTIQTTINITLKTKHAHYCAARLFIFINDFLSYNDLRLILEL